MSASSNKKKTSILFGNYNVLNPFCSDRDKDHPEYLWCHRSIALMQFLKKQKCDIIAMNEVNLDVIKTFRKKLSDEYIFHGYSTETGLYWKNLKKTDYYGSIVGFLVKKKGKIYVVSHKCIELPKGKRHKRILVELKAIVDNDKYFTFYSSQYDHLSKESREKSKEVELKKFKFPDEELTSYGPYIISGGDKNWFRDSHEKSFESDVDFFEATVLKQIEGPTGTYAGHINENPKFARRIISGVGEFEDRKNNVATKNLRVDASTIDHIIISKNLFSKGYKTNYIAFTRKFNYIKNKDIENAQIALKRFCSDHFFMSAKIETK